MVRLNNNHDPLCKCPPLCVVAKMIEITLQDADDVQQLFLMLAEIQSAMDCVTGVCDCSSEE